MDQENVNKLAEWIKANRNYPDEQLRQAALQGGSSEENFNAAMNIVNAPVATLIYKGVGIRFFAFFVDLIVFGVVFWLFMRIFGSTHAGPCYVWIGAKYSTFNETTLYGLCNLSAILYFLTVFVYYVLFEWKIGGTLGKLITGMRVIKVTGEPINLKDSLIRNILRIVDFFPFFYLVGAISIWNSKIKQRVGDRLAKTVVVSKNSNKISL